jgi:hypothetical protein
MAVGTPSTALHDSRVEITIGVTVETIMSEEAGIPSVLYKYRKADDHTLQLLEGQLYFARPRDLNDPTELDLIQGVDQQINRRVQDLEQLRDRLCDPDCDADEYRNDLLRKASEQERQKPSFAFPYEMIDEDTITWLRSNARQRRRRKVYAINRKVELYRAKRTEEGNQTKSKIEKLESELQSLQAAVREASSVFERVASTTGLLCLSATPHQYGMWCQYANGFDGVCVGFDRNKLTRALRAALTGMVGPLIVKYRNMPIDEIVAAAFLEGETNIYCCKPEYWSYEQELRFVRVGGWGIVEVPADCVTRIIIGAKVNEEYRQRIAAVIERRGKARITGDSSPVVEFAKADALATVHILDGSLPYSWPAAPPARPRLRDVDLDDEIPF